jgi:hypothetical protein
MVPRGGEFLRLLNRKDISLQRLEDALCCLPKRPDVQTELSLGTPASAPGGIAHVHVGRALPAGGEKAVQEVEEHVRSLCG